MKKLSVIIVLLLGVAATWFLVKPSTNIDNLQNAGTNSTGDSSVNTDPSNGLQNAKVADDGSGMTETGSGDQGVIDMEDRPATEIYKSAEEAFKAVKDGSSRYDDIILEQFTQLGPECTWCDGFYKTVRDSLISDTTLSADQKSYFAEIMAISGRVENVSSLIDMIEKAPNEDQKQIFSDALEMTVGKDDVVKLLGGKLSSIKDDVTKESVVAAIANQGSQLAIDTLYKFTVDSKNPDGFYSAGTGLGEVIPSEDAFPLLKQIALKKDDYSHLAVKSLLNAGPDGVKAVFEMLASSNDPDADRKILKDAIDHINYDEDTEKFLQDAAANSKNPALAELAKSSLESFKNTELDEESTDVGAEENPVTGKNSSSMNDVQ